MGSVPAQTPIVLSPIHHSVPLTQSQTIKKAENIQASFVKVNDQPHKIEVVEVVQKQTKIPWKENSEKLTQIGVFKDIAKNEFRIRFLTSVSKKETRLIFKPKYSCPTAIPKSSLLAKLQVESDFDLQLYEKVLEMRIRCALRQKVKDKREEEYDREEELDLLKAEIEKDFHSLVVALLGEASGKSFVWTVMNLSIQSRRAKLLNFLHEEGIQQSTVPFLQIDEHYRSYF